VGDGTPCAYHPGALHVVHHPDYVAPPSQGSSFPHDKYGLVMDAFGQSGVEMTVYMPVLMPRAWLDAIHDPYYVEGVLSCTLPPETHSPSERQLLGTACERTNDLNWDALLPGSCQLCEWPVSA